MTDNQITQILTYLLIFMMLKLAEKIKPVKTIITTKVDKNFLMSLCLAKSVIKIPIKITIAIITTNSNVLDPIM